MSIFRPRGSAVWYYDFRCGGHRFSGSTGATGRRDAEAVERRARQQAALTLAAGRARRAAPLTMDVACQRYWLECGQHAARPDNEERALAWLAREVGPQTPVEAIDDAMVARLVAIRRGQRVVNAARGPQTPGKLLSPATVNRSMTEPLRRVLRRAERVWKVPVQRIDWRQHLLKEPHERVRELRADEEAALFAHLRGVYVDLVRFALRAGLRRANVIGLAWADVDFGARQITVVMKGDRTHTLPLTPDLRELLWRQRGRHATQVWAHADGAPVTVAAAVSAVRRALRKAGIEDFHPFHDLRHTAATRITRETGNLRHAQKLLGHTTITTTARYAHVTLDDLRDAMTAVAEAEAAIVPPAIVKKVK